MRWPLQTTFAPNTCIQRCVASRPWPLLSSMPWGGGPFSCIVVSGCSAGRADGASPFFPPQQFRKLFASDEELFAKFEKRFRALERTAEKHPDTFFNTKDLFSAMVPAAKKYLAGQPWEMFLQRWARFALGPRVAARPTCRLPLTLFFCSLSHVVPLVSSFPTSARILSATASGSTSKPT